jgi:hypothetical protein
MDAPLQVPGVLRELVILFKTVALVNADYDHIVGLSR